MSSRQQLDLLLEQIKKDVQASVVEKIQPVITSLREAQQQQVLELNDLRKEHQEHLDSLKLFNGHQVQHVQGMSDLLNHLSATRAELHSAKERIAQLEAAAGEDHNELTLRTNCDLVKSSFPGSAFTATDCAPSDDNSGASSPSDDAPDDDVPNNDAARPHGSWRFCREMLRTSDFLWGASDPDLIRRVFRLEVDNLGKAGFELWIQAVHQQQRLLLSKGAIQASALHDAFSTKVI